MDKLKRNTKLNIIDEIRQKIEKNIIENNLIQNDDKIVVAVSGGPDSMCLLDNLNQLKAVFKEKYNISYDLFVAHVNHKIRVESEAEKVYVKNFCDSINVPFYYKEANIPELTKVLKLSEETCGRKIRYDFFDEIIKKVNATKLAVAHNLNDNVETILLNIIRGCGLNGLIGMDFSCDNLIRPLINIEKKDILEYCEKRKLNPCFDYTNDLDIHMRNKVRVRLIPSLKNEYNKNILQNIIRMKELVQEDNNFLEEYTKKVVDDSTLNVEIKENDIDKSSIKFNFSRILNEHDAIKKRAIRQIILKKLGNLDGIEKIHINDIILLFEKNIKGKKYIIGNKFTIEIVKKDIGIIY